jgi:hypothetical protein
MQLKAAMKRNAATKQKAAMMQNAAIQLKAAMKRNRVTQFFGSLFRIDAMAAVALLKGHAPAAFDAGAGDALLQCVCLGALQRVSRRHLLHEDARSFCLLPSEEASARGYAALLEAVAELGAFLARTRGRFDPPALI